MKAYVLYCIANDNILILEFRRRIVTAYMTILSLSNQKKLGHFFVGKAPAKYMPDEIRKIRMDTFWKELLLVNKENELSAKTCQETVFKMQFRFPHSLCDGLASVIIDLKHFFLYYVTIAVKQNIFNDIVISDFLF